MKLSDLFLEFAEKINLNDKACIERIIETIGNSVKNNQYMHALDCVNQGLIWSSTKEGHAFWDIVRAKWLYYALTNAKRCDFLKNFLPTDFLHLHKEFRHANNGSKASKVWKQIYDAMNMYIDKKGEKWHF